MKKTVSGLNIQWPWSELLINGSKSVETRGYPLPKKYIGVELAIIETAGPRGRREAGIEFARIIGTVVFEESFEYVSREKWEKDRKRHRVSVDDPLFKYDPRVKKFGWVVKKVTRLPRPLPAPKPRGIVFASECHI